jgi:translation initiation factor 5B
MRDKHTAFVSVESVTAANGVRISAPGSEDAVAGMPLRATDASTLDEVKAEISAEVGEVMPATEEVGVVAKADSLGSLEALLRLLKEAKIPVSRAGVGMIGKQDIAAAEAMLSNDKLAAVIIGFNVPRPDEAPVKIITSDVIYRVIEEYQAWIEGETRNTQKAEREALPYPCRIRLMPGYIFRQSNPAVCGVEVLAGTLKAGMKMMKKDGAVLTTVRGIQKERETVEKAEKNEQVAASFSDVVIGRQLFENDVLYTVIEEPDFRKLKDVKNLLREDEKEVLREVGLIMREKNPVWGV